MLIMTWLERLLGATLLASILLNFGNVVGRYVFATTLISADELQVFALVAITFLGAAIVTWRAQHLRMDVLRPLFPPVLGSAVRMVETVLAGAVIVFVCSQSV